MASILLVGTHGPDDPTRASFPFQTANGAVEAGHRPTVALLADAVFILKESIADSILPVGLTPPIFANLIVDHDRTATF